MKFIDDCIGSPVFAVLVIVTCLAGVLLGFTIAYGITYTKCANYANGKGAEYSVAFPAQCWIKVEGKNYTMQEYSNKFEGILISK